MLELPLPGRSKLTERGISEEQIEELRAILAVFRFRLNADTLLDVSLTKALLDGPTLPVPPALASPLVDTHSLKWSSTRGV